MGQILLVPHCPNCPAGRVFQQALGEVGSYGAPRLLLYGERDHGVIPGGCAEGVGRGLTVALALLLAFWPKT